MVPDSDADVDAADNNTDEAVAGTSMLNACLPELISLAISSTGDKEIQDVFARKMATHPRGLLGNAAFADLEGISAFSARVFHHCSLELIGWQKATEVLRAELRATALKFDSERSSLNHAKETLSVEISNLQRVIKTLNELDECRNTVCSAEFKCYINLDEKIVRCSKCMCKHR